MKSLPRMFAAFAAVCLTASVALADASGTWKWQEQGRGGSTPREVSATLSESGGKLTGKISRPGRDGNTTTTEITNGSVKGDTVSFTLEREFNGNKFVTKYSGKLSGDAITGESESPGRDGGAPTKREWTAKRAK